jgi:TonB family protein
VWSNTSGQGGGVRLIGLRPTVRRELQQWIHSEMSSDDPKKSAPVPGRKASVHAPVPATREPAAPVSRPTVGRKSSSRHDTPHPKATTGAKARVPFADAQAEPRTRLFTTATVIAGCIATGVVAMAFSGINPILLVSSGDTGVAIAASSVPSAPVTAATPELPAIGNETPSPGELGLQSGEMSLPPAARATGASAGTPVPPTQPKALAPSTVPVQASRPEPRPPAQPVRSQQLSMALPRPQSPNPASPIVAVPEAPLALQTPPAALLMDMPALSSRPPAPPQPVQPRVSTGYRQPQLLSRVEPVYSPLARRARLQGTVQVSATIGPDGMPQSPVCVTGNALLCQMALEAVGKWRYEPATSNGQPVEAQTLITFNFQFR